MKTQTAEEILDKHVGLGVLRPYPDVKSAMNEFATTQIEALRERLREEFKGMIISTHAIDQTINEFLKKIND